MTALIPVGSSNQWNHRRQPAVRCLTIRAMATGNEAAVETSELADRRPAGGMS
jgi:hypothetical protein